ncbi:hypothetical protein AK830_g2799 [Neonectria ditissima]|uniref:SRR1-like domain-containing protein n=1 Tax=Neonectria ditissima TaxID=78410 RepID=A0A0P7BE00_9HYPO|nr:hypothetical protein AK830_g2799 [Neonectria ditissima]
MDSSSDTSSNAGLSRAYQDLAKIQNRVITPKKRELGNYVRDLYASGAKMFTKDMLRRAEADLAKSPLPDQTEILCMNGMTYAWDLARRRDDEIEEHNVPCLDFHIYQGLVFETERSFGSEATEAIEDKIPITDEDRAYASQAVYVKWSTENSPSHVDYARLQEAWDESREIWLNSDSCTHLTEALEKTKPKVQKLVCFGLGSLEGTAKYSSLEKLHIDGRPRRSAISQHLAAITMADVLGKQQGTARLPILVQDPDYTTLAKEFLAAQDIEVVGGRGALGFTYIDDDSLVFSCHPNVPVKQIVADLARPAAMLWNEVEYEERKPEFRVEVMGGEERLCWPWVTDEDSPRTREMVQEYDLHAFKLDVERFGELAFYVRKD